MVKTLEEIAKIKDKATDCIENIINELEHQTGMVCSDIFVLTDEENNKSCIDLHLRLKVGEEIEE